MLVLKFINLYGRFTFSYNWLYHDRPEFSLFRKPLFQLSRTVLFIRDYFVRDERHQLFRRSKPLGLDTNPAFQELSREVKVYSYLDVVL